MIPVSPGLHSFSPFQCRSLRLVSRQDQLQRMAELNIHLICASKEIDDQGAFIPQDLWGAICESNRSDQQHIKSGMIVANEGNFSGTDDVENTTFARFYPFYFRANVLNGVVIAPHEAINRVQLLKMSTSYPASYVLKEKGARDIGNKASWPILWCSTRIISRFHRKRSPPCIL